MAPSVLFFRLKHKRTRPSHSFRFTGGSGFRGSIRTTDESTLGGGRKLFLPTWEIKSEIFTVYVRVEVNQKLCRGPTHAAFDEVLQLRRDFPTSAKRNMKEKGLFSPIWAIKNALQKPEKYLQTACRVTRACPSKKGNGVSDAKENQLQA